MENEEKLLKEIFTKEQRKKYNELIDESIKRREFPPPRPEDVEKYKQIISKKTWLKKYGDRIVGAEIGFAMSLLFLNQFYPLIENAYAIALFLGSLGIVPGYLIYRWKKMENECEV